MKNRNGITLIALVITIVVLIILASITINLTIGENGIFTFASDAKTKAQEAEELEKIKLAVLTSQMNQEAKLNKKQLRNNLANTGVVKSGNPATDEEAQNKAFPWNIVGNTGKTYVINQNGSVTVLEEPNNSGEESNNPGESSNPGNQEDSEIDLSETIYYALLLQSDYPDTLSEDKIIKSNDYDYVQNKIDEIFGDLIEDWDFEYPEIKYLNCVGQMKLGKDPDEDTGRYWYYVKYYNGPIIADSESEILDKLKEEFAQYYEYDYWEDEGEYYYSGRIGLVIDGEDEYEDWMEEIFTSEEELKSTYDDWKERTFDSTFSSWESFVYLAEHSSEIWFEYSVSKAYTLNDDVMLYAFEEPSNGYIYAKPGSTVDMNAFNVSEGNDLEIEGVLGFNSCQLYSLSWWCNKIYTPTEGYLEGDSEEPLFNLQIITNEETEAMESQVDSINELIDMIILSMQ